MTEEEIRKDERQKCWDEIDAAIIPGELPGNGCDRSAERNGLIHAANIIFRKLMPESHPDYRPPTRVH